MQPPLNVPQQLRRDGFPTEASLSICLVKTTQPTHLTALDSLMRSGMWSAPVLKTSTSAAEHLPVPRRMPHRRQRQRGNMADDSAPTKTPPPLRPSLVRMRKEFGSRDPGFKVGVSGQFNEDDFQPRLIINPADLIAQTVCCRI